MSKYDAVVIGSGPNGLAAGITLAREGLSVLILEGQSTIGGGMRSKELTLPGFVHDVCSAIHPLGIGSPFFRQLPLKNFGLNWIQPPVPLAHAFANSPAVFLERTLEDTILQLGDDATHYRKLVEPLVNHWSALAEDVLAPFHFPRHPLVTARFGFYGIRSAENLVNEFFQNKSTRALFGGLAAHSILPLDKLLTAGYGLIFCALAHLFGWPLPSGGTQNLANALAAYFLELGGKIQTDTFVENLNQIPESKTIFFNLSPQQMIKIVGNRFPTKYIERVDRYRYGPGVFKVDWALNNPIPWKDERCKEAGTVHLGESFEEIAASEKLVWEGEMPKNHFLILAQPTLFDALRAPPEKHVAWCYCHVPHGSEENIVDGIEKQIEVAAPGFRDCIIARHVMNPRDLEKYNPNYVGGDISGGVQDLTQLYTRPVASIVPYATPLKGMYICSASTPPGGGVHGMCGYYAARAALKTCF